MLNESCAATKSQRVHHLRAQSESPQWIVAHALQAVIVVLRDELRLPIVGHTAGRSWSGLTSLMGPWRGEMRTVLRRRLRLIVVEPMLVRLEAGDDGMTARMKVLGRVLTG